MMYDLACIVVYTVFATYLDFMENQKHVWLAKSRGLML